MSKVFPRHTAVELPVAVSGDGVYLVDSTGKRYLDASGGAAVSCLGHNDPGIIAAIKSQLDKLEFAHTSFFTSEPAEQLAATLIANLPDNIPGSDAGKLDRVYFVSGGSEAIEAALKLARQYFLEIGQPARQRIIARRQSYHGNTLGALATGGNAWRRQPFAPLLVETSHIAPCYAYRGKLAGETDREYGHRVAEELRTEIERLGAGNVMAFVAETVVGATLGAVPAVEGYFQRIREICDEYGVLLILDEVMCGMGRTGSIYAFAQEAIRPDILAIAKGLGAGYQPIGAMLCSAEIYAAVKDGSGFFQHGHTYLGHPVACAASLAVLKAITERGLIARVKTQGARLLQALAAEFAGRDYIGDIRGRGLFIGIEIVKDKATKAPFDPTLQLHKKLKQAAMHNGLICYPMGGSVETPGSDNQLKSRPGDHVLLAPPFILAYQHIDELIDKLDKSFRALAIE